MNIITEHPVAVDSPDHLYPHGTRIFGRSNPRFIIKLMNLFPSDYFPSLLDLGCGSGVFVREALDMGIDAYGVEGSDCSKNMRRAAWRDIPERLCTCDIAEPFRIRPDIPTCTSLARCFDVITAWEVVEHIPESGLCGLVANIDQHLKPDGFLIVSTVNGACVLNGGVDLHQVHWPKSEWIKFFEYCGFIHDERLVKYFNTQFVRGSKFGSEGSFHLCLRRRGVETVIPHEPLSLRLYDRWLGTLAQRFLAGSFIQR